MKNKSIVEGVISFVFLTILLLFVNPFDLWMPEPLVMTLLCVVAVLALLLGSFVWQEKVTDEREGIHRMFAGRIGFLVGAGVLVIGIIFQEYKHQLDPWLVHALASMIIGKTLALWYSQKHQ